jgi:hypothetical protein
MKLCAWNFIYILHVHSTCPFRFIFFWFDHSNNFLRRAKIIIFLRIIISFDMTPYSMVDHYHRFGRTCCLHLESWRCFALLPWRQGQQVSVKQQSTRLHCVTFYSSEIFIITTDRNSDLGYEYFHFVLRCRYTLFRLRHKYFRHRIVFDVPQIASGRETKLHSPTICNTNRKLHFLLSVII